MCAVSIDAAISAIRRISLPKTSLSASRSPHQRVEHERAEEENAGKSGRPPIAGRDPDHDQDKAHDRARRRHEERHLELPRQLALSALQYKEGPIHHREDKKQEKDGRGRELGNRAQAQAARG